MPNKTANYNLIKPLGSEHYDINVHNGNMDIIDEELKKITESNDKRIDEIKSELKDSSLEVFKTEGQTTKLDGCSGGFVNIEKVQGKTELKDGKLVSVGEPIGVGSNLSDGILVVGGYLNTNGQLSTTATDWRATSQYIQVDPAKNYLLKYSGTQQNYFSFYYDSNKNYVSYSVNSILPPQNCSYIKFSFDHADISNITFKECNYRIEILSQGGKNLFDINNATWGYYWVSGNSSIANSNLGCFYELIPCLPNTNYTLSSKSLDSKTFRTSIGVLDSNKNGLNFNYDSVPKTSNTITITTPSNGKYLCVSQLDFLSTDIQNIEMQLEQGTSVTTYEPYKGDKTEILMQQPLRKWDSIETNGVITRGSGQVTFNGSEGWILGTNLINTINFYVDVQNLKTLSSFICDKFKSQDMSFWQTSDTEFMASNISIGISILKSKLTTQDLAGFKTWLSQNPVTVVYQLATPTTENTNKTLILKGYDNLIVNAGAVQREVSYSYSKTSGGRFCSIENAVQVLKENAEKSTQDIKENLKYTIENLNKNNMKNDNDMSAVKTDINKSKNDISVLRTDLSNAIKTIPLVSFGTADPTPVNVPLNGIYIKI